MKYLKSFETLDSLETYREGFDGTTYVLLDLESNTCKYSNDYITIPDYPQDDFDSNEWVDLGLSVLWASHNLGAELPCDTGKYYAWGGTEGYNAGDDAKNHAGWANVPFNGGSGSFNTAVFSEIRSTAVPNDVLALEYDAVYQTTNGEGRIPTKDEFSELLDNPNITREYCTFSFLGDDHATHSFYGYKFESTVTGNKIFIPSKGYFGSSSATPQNEASGYYMSSSIDTSSLGKFMDLTFSSSKCQLASNSRANLYPIRGVRDRG